jgi:hypothetical protein
MPNPSNVYVDHRLGSNWVTAPRCKFGDPQMKQCRRMGNISVSIVRGILKAVSSGLITNELGNHGTAER